ncbi:MAG: hypothetical protein KME31_16135, partial [Tolypothrix carrinoi HA7290-LM1]|nr:hypothetical protein [Tolypothrix carrinoi HA7290-LM1]
MRGVRSPTYWRSRGSRSSSKLIWWTTNPSCGLSIDTACDHSIHAIAYNKVALVRSANVPMPLLPVF